MSASTVSMPIRTWPNRPSTTCAPPACRMRDITVISSEPFEHFEFGHRDAKTAMPWIAAAAGLFGLVATYYLLGVSQMSWPLKTAGMPIVPLWTNLIIIFEMTMLSAIIATVITLLITAGLPSRGGKLYDPKCRTVTSSSASRIPPMRLASSRRSPSTALA